MSDPNIPTPAAEAARAAAVGPDQRQALVRNYQEAALQRPDPLAANLGVLNGDLMSIAHGITEQLQARPQAAQPLEKWQQFAQRAELLLKFVRQIDRLAHLEVEQLEVPKTGGLIP